MCKFLSLNFLSGLNSLLLHGLQKPDQVCDARLGAYCFACSLLGARVLLSAVSFLRNAHRQPTRGREQKRMPLPSGLVTFVA